LEYKKDIGDLSEKIDVFLVHWNRNEAKIYANEILKWL